MGDLEICLEASFPAAPGGDILLPQPRPDCRAPIAYILKVWTP